MRSFTDPSTLDPVPAYIVRLLAKVDRGQGKEDLYRHRAPQRLDELATTARVASAMTSSAIEGIIVPRRRAEAVLAKRDKPRNDNELELDGYRLALDDVYGSPLPELNISRLLHWHRLLKQRTEPDSAGRLKTDENGVYDVLSDGTRRSRFRTVSAAFTQDAVRELCMRYEQAYADDIHHPLVLISAVALDFLTIHPFHDGNGRVARILTNALAIRHGYQVVRYQSLEQLIADHRDEYLASLAASTDGWHEAEHSLWPWLTFLVARFEEAYQRLDVTAASPSFAELRAVIKTYIDRQTDEFAIADLRQAIPMASDDLLREQLNEAVRNRSITRVGGGRGSRYRPLGTATS